uniref:Uncharacterized protein n=1 Tax=Lepeophtheirus salmonis TaxID=72036 RepID=A0A0K2UJ44_LEPSM
MQKISGFQTYPSRDLSKKWAERAFLGHF